MADQGKWFKLWCSALTDAALCNLPNSDWACWAKLGAYIKLHGTQGKLIVEAPAVALQNIFQVSTFDAVLMALKRLPNCHFGDRNSTVSSGTNTTVSLIIEYQNWHKYQDDLSSRRVRNFRARKRAHETIQEEKRSRRDVEEKRRDIPPLPPKQFSKPNPDQVTAYAKSIGFVLDGRRFCDHYEANGWKIGKNPMKNWQAAVRTWKGNDYGGAPNGNHVGKSIFAQAAERERTQRTVPDREELPPGEVLARVRNLPTLSPKT